MFVIVDVVHLYEHPPGKPNAMPTNKFPEQAEHIERVKTILNMTDEALAAEVGVRPETLQKYAAGYQKAGDKLMQIIIRLPEMRRRPYYATPSSGESPSSSSMFTDRATASGVPEPPSAQEQLGIVLSEGTLDEVRLLRQVISTLYRQVEGRRQPASAASARVRRIALLEGRPRLLPALGYVPAGLPQGGVEQIADKFIAIPAEEYPEADYALKVQGDSMVDADIHHGDWVLMSQKRQARDGNIVAALCDSNETTLKTYVTGENGQPYLRSENGAYPAQIIPRSEMQIQGVMVGKLRMTE